MAAITEEEMTAEQWCAMLGVNLEWYRRQVHTDPLLDALNDLTRELWVARERMLARMRELMTDDDSHAVWVAVGELYRLAGGDAVVPDQLRQLHEDLYRR